MEHHVLNIDSAHEWFTSADHSLPPAYSFWQEGPQPEPWSLPVFGPVDEKALKQIDQGPALLLSVSNGIFQLHTLKDGEAKKIEADYSNPEFHTTLKRALLISPSPRNTPRQVISLDREDFRSLAQFIPKEQPDCHQFFTDLIEAAHEELEFDKTITSGLLFS